MSGDSFSAFRRVVGDPSPARGVAHAGLCYRRFARSITVLFAVLCLCFPPASAVAADSVDVVVEGLDGELLDNARASLSLERRRSERLGERIVRELFAAGEGEIERSLQPFGYYRPTIQSTLTPPAGPDSIASLPRKRCAEVSPPEDCINSSLVPSLADVFSPPVESAVATRST